uniref:Uncharacterized protein n=1 Tax=Verrucosispora sp. MS100047 TaxID=1410949 RepID=A0A097CS15_9ACTN|nr:hypothetical protein VASRM7_187 [Verrucosispora sp. MS100047]
MLVPLHGPLPTPPGVRVDSRHDGDRAVTRASRTPPTDTGVGDAALTQAVAQLYDPEPEHHYDWPVQRRFQR